MPAERVLVGLFAFAFGCTPDGLVPDAARLVVERGAIEERVFLTGEIDAAVATMIDAPRTDDGGVTIRWIAEDGTHVRAGDRVVELDNAALIDKIREAELAMVEAAIAFTQQEAETDVAVADKRFDVVKQESALAKAQLDLTIPPDLVSRRESKTFEVTASRAKVDLANAEGTLRSTKEGGKLAAQVKRIAYDKTARALKAAEERLVALEVTAPRDGIFILGQHPWENRKYQVGDQVWPGMTLGKVPELAELVVQAVSSDVDDGRVLPGMAVSCVVDAYADAPIAGHVVAVSPVAQEGGRQSTRRFFAVRVAVEHGETTARLRPGLSVRVEVLTRQSADAVLAPRAGLHDDGAGNVTARLADGREVPVTIDFCDAQRCAIGEGLTEGDVLEPVEAAG